MEFKRSWSLLFAVAFSLMILAALLVGMPIRAEAATEDVTIGSSTSSQTWGSGSSTMKWDKSSGTLYLNNYTINGTLTLYGAVKVLSVSGDNTINGGEYGIYYKGGNTDSLIIRSTDTENPGTLTVKCDGGSSYTKTCAIYVYTAPVSIESVTVTAIGGTAQNRSYGIYIGQSLRLTNATLRVTGGTGETQSSTGIFTIGDMTCINSNVEAKAGTGYNSIGIQSAETLTTNNSTVYAEGNSNAFYSAGIQASNGITFGSATKVTAIGGNADNSYGIIVSQGKVTSEYTNSVVTAVAGIASNQSYGILTKGQSQFSGVLTSIGNGAAPNAAGYSDDSGTTHALNYSIRNTNGTEQSSLSITGLPASTIQIGTNFKLSVTGGSGNGIYVWESSDSKIATVNQNGEVKVVGVGQVTVTARRTADGTYKEQSQTVTFTAECDHANSEHTTADTNENGTHTFNCTVCGNSATENCFGGTANCIKGKICSLCNAEYTDADKNNHVDDQCNYTVESNKIVAACTNCGEGRGVIAFPSNLTFKYVGKPVTVVVEKTGVFASESITIEYNTENHSAPTTPGKYTASVTYGGRTITTSVEIVKGTLMVMENPTATCEYGESFGNKRITGGKVYLDGNNELLISGTWTWVTGTNTATFAFDEQYKDLVEELTSAYTVTVTVTKTTPVVEIKSPVPAIMPGGSITFQMQVTNPHTQTPESLPTGFRFVYKIGKNGVWQTLTSSKFTVPADADYGETIYVYVETLEEEGKYNVGKSNTLELLVGQVDYTAQISELENAIKELQKLVDEKADAETIAQKMSELESRIKTLEDVKDAFVSADAQLKSDLEESIATAKREAIKAAEDALAEAKADLEAAIAKKADTETLNKEVADLKKAIETAEAAAKAYADELDTELKNALAEEVAKANALISALDERLTTAEDAIKAIEKAIEELKAVDAENAKALADAIANLNKAIEDAKDFATSSDEALKTALTKLIEDADKELEKKINTVQKNLDEIAEELRQSIADGKADVEAKVAELKKAIEAAEVAAKAYADAQDTVLKEALEEKISKANLLISALENRMTLAEMAIDALEKAIEELKAVDAENAQALADAIANLNKAIEDARSFATSSDEALKNELTQAIEAADKALEAKIASVQEKLDEAKAALEEKDAQLAEKDSRLQNFITAVCIMSAVTLCGSGAFVVWFFIDRKKRS